MKSNIPKRNEAVENPIFFEALKTETNFENYLKMLRSFARKYCVAVVGSDTPWGPPFTKEHAKLMLNIGFKEILLGKFRCGYAAVIDAGKLVFERLEEDTQIIIDKTISSGGLEIKLISAGFNAVKVNNPSRIEINGAIYSQKGRGLNFVVYDKAKQTVIDSVCFDVYTAGVPAFRYSKYPQMVKEFSEEHPEITLFTLSFPKFPDKDISEGERKIKEHNILFSQYQLSECLSEPSYPLKKYYDADGIAEVLSVPKSYFEVSGARRFEDMNGKYINISGGHRVTNHQPSGSNINIFMCGGCRMFGIGSDDNNTIASHLQEFINQNIPNCNIAVQNYGFFLCETDRRSEERPMILKSLPVKPGDIVICDFGSGAEGIFDIDTSGITAPPRTCDIFFDSAHITPDGNRLIAEKIFESLQSQGVFDKAQNFDKFTPPPGMNNASECFDQITNAELAEYQKFLRDFYNSSLKQTIGAVVMNCNPFTLGHRYLIEKALEQCDFLILFLVEEDKSIFKFEDRLKLVDEGTKDIPNLAIIPSGKFVLSSLTFSEYFNKSELQDRVIDTSLDVTVFARDIAPCLNITKRFAGEEPFDNITRQYNETMRKVLPEYGIEFVEIPRKGIGDKPISASYVRSLLKDRDFEAIKALVPTDTYIYLLENELKKMK